MEALVLWLKKEPPSVYETIFSYRYCQRKSEELTGTFVLEVSSEITSSELLTILNSLNLYPKSLIIVAEPETVISRPAFEILSQEVQRGFILGPVFNDTINPVQRAELPYPYLDAFTFSEVAQEIAKRNQLIETSVLEAACFACSLADLSRWENSLIRDIPLSSNLAKKVATGALVHRFLGYYDSERLDLLSIMPSQIKHLLDIGCARGRFGRILKNCYPGIILEGVELNPILAEEAKRIYDQVYLGRFEEIDLSEGTYDLVHMGDVLEHLYDPWEALGKVKKLLKPGGYFTGSIPNVSHWSIVQQLLKGQFEYIPVGLLCVSHIRFFTLSSFRKLLEDLGFELEYFERQTPSPTPRGRKLITTLVESGLAREEEVLTAEILFRARKVS